MTIFKIVKCSRNILLMSLAIFLFRLGNAQTVVKSADSLVEVSSFLSNGILMNESIADTIIVKVKGKKPLVIPKLGTDEFLNKYEQNKKILDKMTYQGEPYCNYIPNCDKILRLPFIKAVQPMGQGKYALIGYLRAKSPMTIIRHIWILDTNGSNLKIEKRIAYFGNSEYISFSYNLLENEVFVFHNIPEKSPIRDNGIFIIQDNWMLTDNDISEATFNKEDFQLFVQKAGMQKGIDIGIGIYKIPTGEPYGKIPPAGEDVALYKILLK